MNKLVITSIPGKYNSYFQWFLLGFYQMSQNGELNIEFKLRFKEKIRTITSNRYIIGLTNRLFKPSSSYLLEGYYENREVKHYFCIDISDAPNLYYSSHLIHDDLYFKVQCPKVFDKSGFQLSSKIRLPWVDEDATNGLYEARDCTDVLFANLAKVKPLLESPRKLSNSNTRKSLQLGYDNYRKDNQTFKKKKMMCYFGNSKGPCGINVKNLTSPNMAEEYVIIGYFGDKINHPNEKRKIAADILKELGDKYDSRIINDGNADTGTVSNPELIIPLKDFCRFISEFEYNLNISGFTRSIPSRFLESFMVGTAIVTDELAVKWYHPFEEEVFETVEMGYLRKEDVEWDKFRNDIKSLPNIDGSKINELFEKKWAPIQTARYIVEELKK